MFTYNLSEFFNPKSAINQPFCPRFCSFSLHSLFVVPATNNLYTTNSVVGSYLPTTESYLEPFSLLSATSRLPFSSSTSSATGDQFLEKMPPETSAQPLDHVRDHRHQ
jgi:hypothetical protein